MILWLVVRPPIVRRSAAHVLTVRLLAVNCSVQLYWEEVERKGRRTREGLGNQFTGDEIPGRRNEQGHGPAAAAVRVWREKRKHVWDCLGTLVVDMVLASGSEFGIRSRGGLSLSLRSGRRIADQRQIKQRGGIGQETDNSHGLV